MVVYSLMRMSPLQSRAGGRPCKSTLWLSDSELECALQGNYLEGTYNVTAAVRWDASVWNTASVAGAVCQVRAVGGYWAAHFLCNRYFLVLPFQRTLQVLCVRLLHQFIYYRSWRISSLLLWAGWFLRCELHGLSSRRHLCWT